MSKNFYKLKKFNYIKEPINGLWVGKTNESRNFFWKTSLDSSRWIDVVFGIYGKQTLIANKYTDILASMGSMAPCNSLHISVGTP